MYFYNRVIIAHLNADWNNESEGCLKNLNSKSRKIGERNNVDDFYIKRHSGIP